MKIFISYRREDSAGHTGRLYDSLKEHFGAENVFMDLSAIESGQNFADAIETAVGSCDALIAVIGQQWLTGTTPGGGRRLDDPRDFVRTEIAAALERRRPVVPVLVERAAMPAAEALPDVLKPLAGRQAHEVSDHRWSYDVERLIEATEKLAGPRPRWQPRTRVFLAAGVLAAILAALFWFRPLWKVGDTIQDAGAYYARGTQYLMSGDYDRAITEFDQAITLDRRAESYYNRGMAYYSKNDIDAAIANWNEAINLDPRDARAYRQRANAYTRKGDYTLAVADYDRAIELEPKDAKAYYNRGLVFKARGEPAKAAADFKIVVTLANDPDAERDARARLGELDGAAPTSAGLAGDWIAQVTYRWGAKYAERFSFKLDGDEVLGTASFLGVARSIVGGTLNGDTVRFNTRTQEVSGDSLVHHYRGRISGDTITFAMHSEGSSSALPIEFTATRESNEPKPQPQRVRVPQSSP